MESTRRGFGAIFMGLGTTGAWEQSSRAMTNHRQLLGGKTLPSFLRRPVESLGARLVKDGQELVVGSGQIEIAGVNYPATTLRQLPNLLKVDVGGGRGRVLAFDRANGKSSATTNGRQVIFGHPRSKRSRSEMPFASIVATHEDKVDTTSGNLSFAIPLASDVPPHNRPDRSRI